MGRKDHQSSREVFKVEAQSSHKSCWCLSMLKPIPYMVPPPRRDDVICCAVTIRTAMREYVELCYPDRVAGVT